MHPEEIIVLVLVAAVIMAFYLWRGGKLGGFASHAKTPKRRSAKSVETYAAENRALADRVAVLERIITDRGYDLADQIEALRDQRREDARGLEADSGVALDFAKKEQV